MDSYRILIHRREEEVCMTLQRGFAWHMIVFVIFRQQYCTLESCIWDITLPFMTYALAISHQQKLWKF